jgi:hypothetical protein
MKAAGCLGFIDVFVQGQSLLLIRRPFSSTFVIGVTPGSRVAHLQELPRQVHADKVPLLFIV